MELLIILNKMSFHCLLVTRYCSLFTVHCISRIEYIQPIGKHIFMDGLGILTNLQ